MAAVTAAIYASARSGSDNYDHSSSLPFNLPLLASFLAFAVAQFLKLFTTWFKERKWDSKRKFSSGGMPSSHSATVTALAASIGLQDGTDGSTFAISVITAAIVMYDAAGIRLHAGYQAELLNQIVCELPPEHPVYTAKPLCDSLGHTPFQVVAGAALGCIIATAMTIYSLDDSDLSSFSTNHYQTCREKGWSLH